MRVVLGAAFAVLVLGGCAQTAREVASVHAARGEEDARARGAAIADRVCRSCHAVRLDDESRNPDAPPLRALSERYPVDALEEAFAEGILVGHPSMPEFRFAPDEIDAIILYLASIQTRGAG